MNATSMFWLLAGIFIGIAITLLFGRLFRARPRAVVAGVAGAGLFAFVAVALYFYFGRPDALVASTTPQSGHMNAASGSPSSMDAAAAQLAARLATSGGTDEEWELLAQSYDFLGRAEDASLARTRKIANASASAPQTDWLTAANEQRRQRNYAAARTSFEAAIQANAMTADAWADYADTLASMATGPVKLKSGAQAIDNALRLQPNHSKALWLKASLAHEEQRFGDALAVWKQLRTVVGDNTADARIVDANIAEAEQLAARPAAQKSKPVAITGTVEIDARLAGAIKPGATLFVYAKSDAPGPPLAVLRLPAANWPVQFTLDDSLAMLPGRTLSSAREVLIEARVSHSGQAGATPGDLQAVATRVRIGGASKPVKLRIDREVGAR